uniref:Uncharacterized protein n=1 Tax=Arundo donax TaxID=35708 RepID=A0A0A8YFQ7_ARUDO
MLRRFLLRTARKLLLLWHHFRPLTLWLLRIPR